MAHATTRKRAPRALAVAALALLGCTGTVTQTHFASGAAGLCSPVRPIGRAALVPETAWRTDQKERARRTDRAARALQRALARSDCAIELRPFERWSSQLEQDQLAALSVDGIDTAIFVRIEELGPSLELTLSLPLLWIGRSEAQLRVRAVHIESGRVLLDAGVKRSTGGPFQLRPAAWAEAELETALAALLHGDRSPVSAAVDRRAAVLQADRERIQAMQSADPERLAALLHENLTYAHSNGRMDSKQSLIESLSSGRVAYRSIEPLHSAVRVYATTAILTARARMRVSADGESLRLDNLYTALYLWESDRWQLSAYHSSPSPAH